VNILDNGFTDFLYFPLKNWCVWRCPQNLVTFTTIEHFFACLKKITTFFYFLKILFNKNAIKTVFMVAECGRIWQNLRARLAESGGNHLATLI
jgi:hypothetical protein